MQSALSREVAGRQTGLQCGHGWPVARPARVAFLRTCFPHVTSTPAISVLLSTFSRWPGDSASSRPRAVPCFLCARRLLSIPVALTGHRPLRLDPSAEGAPPSVTGRP